MPRSKPQSTTKIFAHKRSPTFWCPDGICAAWVAKLAYPDAEVYGCIYQTDPPPVQDGDTIIIVDFSFPIATLNQWRDRGCHIILIDHHKTLADHVREDALNLLERSLVSAISESTQLHQTARDLNLSTVEVTKLKALLGDRTSEAYARYPEILKDFLQTASLKAEGAIALAEYVSDRAVGELFRYVSGGVLSFDMRKCGAVLAWEYFFPHEPVPAFLYYVQDRDLYVNALPHSAEIHEATGYLDRGKFETFKQLIGMSQDELIDQYWLLGATLLAPKRKTIAKLAQKAQWQNICGHQAIALELPSVSIGLSTDICAYLLELNPDAQFAVAYAWKEKEERFKLSFRSLHSSYVDLSELVQQWGGGGHPHAAGASVEKLPWGG